MSQLIIFVLDDPEKTESIVKIWTTRQVPGVTILNSSGLGSASVQQDLADELPLMPTLSSLLRIREAPHCTLFSVIPDDFDVDGLVTATEKISGPLGEPNTGILFTLPINRVWQTQMPKTKR